LQAAAAALAAAHDDDWREPLAQLATATNHRIDAWAAQHGPGLAPAALPSSDAVAAALATYERLLATRAAASQWSSSIVSGILGEAEVAVHLLRCGAAAAWWVDLRGERAGTAKLVDGQVVLQHLADARQQQAIISAWRMVTGVQGAHVVLMPVAHVPVEIH
jgi:hypothetical protein